MRRCLFLLLLCTSMRLTAQDTTLNIIPAPVSVTRTPGTFALSADPGPLRGYATQAEVFLRDYLLHYANLGLHTQRVGHITFRQSDGVAQPGAYRIHITPDSAVVSAATDEGLFYGAQTIIQLLPINANSNGVLTLPCVDIIDSPRFAWRGAHLDVARHFFPLPVVKKYIDYLALHKMNVFHWHLTDDQGWRIQINKWTRLTEIGGCRAGTIAGHYPGTGNDGAPHCGFYTQDEIREVVQYAQDRFITVVPEIEMPGHALAALTAYPSLGCPGTGPYEVQQTWGVFDDVFCAGNDSVFAVLEGVLDEVCALFPSNIIHIGGDECPKENWKTCPRCQARMKAEGLKDEHELQSYFIRRIQKHLTAKGRRIIGWDEILEGGLAPGAAVMSWRGQDGGIAAARQSHDAVMSPGSHCYFDHSQSRNEDSVTFGGYTPLEKVYTYEPVPDDSLTSAQQTHILGAQANLWTEYISNPAKIEYQIFPRMSALAEVLWSPKSRRDWADFERRLPAQFERYALWGANSSPAYYDLAAEVVPAANGDGIAWKLRSNLKSGTVRWARGENVPITYQGPVAVKQSGWYSAAFLQGNQQKSSVSQIFQINKATGKKITLAQKPSDNYPGQGGAFGLVNGIQGEKGMVSSDWLGWWGKDMEATLEFDTLIEFHSISVHVMESEGSWVYRPSLLECAYSADPHYYTNMPASSVFKPSPLGDGWMTVKWENGASMLASRIWIQVTNAGRIPAGKPGAGNDAWLFVDEIIVE